MKCLQLAGDEALANRFIAGLMPALEGRPVLVAGRGPGGNIELTCPGSSGMLSVLKSIPPFLVILRGTPELAAPVIWCGQDPPEDLSSLIMYRFQGDDPHMDSAGIIDRTFHLLPQRTGEECGKCGTDCRGLAEAVIAGSREPGDCFYSAGKVVVEQDGMIMEMGEFPSRVVEGAIRGLLSSLKGYREGSGLIIRLE
jgi:hypothetical protein